ncbi:MAG: cysteate synthase [Candidatus Hydrothermarchaeales archaeon]
MSQKYHLECVECNSKLDVEKKFNFSCPDHNALVRSVYSKKRLKIRDYPGLWRYYDWLPVEEVNDYDGKPITYKSEALAQELGLENLYISFNGYWPEREADVRTCTFKEYEGAVTVQYAKESKVKGIVVASAGNTANAFAYMATKERLPLILIVPKKCICDLRVPKIDTSLVKTIVIGDGDYSDAISIGRMIPPITGYACEGGAKNIARRDGLATVLLDAVQEMKRLPDHYFQAIGSGTGAIAAWEAALRLKDDGRFNKSLPKLQLSQNLNFMPMVKAWKESRRQFIPEIDMPTVNNILEIIYAIVLSNRYPPYSEIGGVYDALLSTNGETYGISKDDAVKASKLFESLEGIDILPAAAVAVASLIQAVDEKKIDPKDYILLNITGGGKKRLNEDHTPEELDVDIEVSKNVSTKELEGLLS